MEIPEVIKPYVVEMATDYTKKDMQQRITTIEALGKKFLKEFPEEDIRVFLNKLRDDNFINEHDKIVPVESMCQNRFETLLGHHLQFWDSKRPDQELLLNQ
jgi:hypothetical protein